MIIDISSGIGQWPFMPLKRTKPEALLSTMKEEGIDLALVAPIDGVCYKNPHMINALHIERLSGFPNLIPIPIINPEMGDAKKEVLRAANLGLPAIKVYPNYHGYSLGCPQMRAIAELCQETNVAIMIQIRMEDVRGHQPMMKIPDVDISEVLSAMDSWPGVTLILCGLCSEIARAGVANRILERPDTYIDTSLLEHVETLKWAMGLVDYNRILLGTHSPFLYIRANMMKVKRIEDDQRAFQAITYANAVRALGLTKSIS